MTDLMKVYLKFADEANSVALGAALRAVADEEATLIWEVLSNSERNAIVGWYHDGHW